MIKEHKKRKEENMYIYSYYAHHGFESPQTLVEAISKKHIKEICLIDDTGMAIPSFLHSCMEKGISVAFAISFTSYIEGYEEKQDGYFITGEKEGLEWVMKTIGELKEKWIPFLNHQELNELQKRNVHCFLKQQQEYIDMVTKKSIQINPVYFKNEEDKKLYQSFYGSEKGFTIDTYRKEEPFIKEIARDPKEFLKIKTNKKQTIDIALNIEWEKFSSKEKSLIKKEIKYFKEKNGLMVLDALHQAKKEQISFIGIGDLSKSLLAYALDINPLKPEKNQLLFDFKGDFSYDILVTQREQKKLFQYLQEKAEIKYPLTKYTLKAKKALKKAQEILGETSKIAYKLNDQESLDEFARRMRMYLIVDTKERQIIDFACHLAKMKEEKCTLKKNYLLFMPEVSHLVKNEEVVYVDVDNLDSLSIPYIRCFYPENLIQNEEKNT